MLRLVWRLGAQVFFTRVDTPPQGHAFLDFKGLDKTKIGQSKTDLDVQLEKNAMLEIDAATMDTVLSDQG